MELSFYVQEQGYSEEVKGQIAPEAACLEYELTMAVHFWYHIMSQGRHQDTDLARFARASHFKFQNFNERHMTPIPVNHAKKNARKWPPRPDIHCVTRFVHLNFEHTLD